MLRIRLSISGSRTKLGSLVDRLMAKPLRPMSGELLCTEAGVALSAKMIRDRFDDARSAAATKAEEGRQRDLAKRIRSFQFRDIRPKAASEIESLEDASKLLGHTSQQITKQVYRRAGEVVKPTK